MGSGRDMTEVSPNEAPPSSIFRRAFQTWPYVFLAISIVGLTYLVFNAFR